MSRTKRSLAIVSAAAIFGIPALCVNRHLFSSYIARPTGFCTNSLPKQSYRKLPAGFPYRFEYAIHAKLLPCSSKDKSKRTIDYWIDLYYPAFDATIYLSYHAVAGNPLFLEKLCKNAHRLALEHQLCASHIETSVIQTQKGYQVHLIELFGQVVTPFQFYTTDGQKHFFRGALYFKTTPKGPKAEAIIAYLKQDIMHMIHTLTWTNL